MPEPENQNDTEQLETIKAQLEEEQQARAALEEAAAGKDSRIAALETELSEAKQAIEQGTASVEAAAAQVTAATAEVASANESRDQAVAKYLNMAKALNPAIPEGIIGGQSIQDIDASVDKGKAIVEAVKKAMEAEAAQTRVPPGAPTRSGTPTEGMSPKEKIAYAVQQKGGS